MVIPLELLNQFPVEVPKERECYFCGERGYNLHLMIDSLLPDSQTGYINEQYACTGCD